MNRLLNRRSLARHCALAAMLAVSLPTQSAETIDVTVAGQVLKPGVYRFEEGARLNNAASAGQVSASAWFLGAALLRDSALEAQTRLKAGLLFELNMNGVHARSRNNEPLQALLGRLHATVDAMPVTGRIQAEMDPLSQLALQNNDLLQHGDTLLYPARPDQVRVMGAVVENCILKHDPLMQLHDYLAACESHRAADRNIAYLIQPDASISQHGIAYWNLEEANVAVGAVIYVPLEKSKLSEQSAGLNEDMAAMLATQYMLGGRFDE